MTPDMPTHPMIAIAWALVLAWVFLGVAMGADVFMSSIEVTSLS